jgi:hypothetical protein
VPRRWGTNTAKPSVAELAGLELPSLPTEPFNEQSGIPKQKVPNIGEASVPIRMYLRFTQIDKSNMLLSGNAWAN